MEERRGTEKWINGRMAWNREMDKWKNGVEQRNDKWKNGMEQRNG